MSDERVQSVVVTGASSGIGAAIARAFGRLGWKVALGARRKERFEAVAREVEELGGVAFAHALDVTNAESVERFFEATEKEFGSIGAVISNAGMNEPSKLADADPSALKREVETNLLGPLYVGRRGVQALCARAKAI